MDFSKVTYFKEKRAEMVKKEAELHKKELEYYGDAWVKVQDLLTPYQWKAFLSQLDANQKVKLDELMVAEKEKIEPFANALAKERELLKAEMKGWCGLADGEVCDILELVEMVRMVSKA